MNRRSPLKLLGIVSLLFPAAVLVQACSGASTTSADILAPNDASTADGGAILATDDAGSTSVDDAGTGECNADIDCALKLPATVPPGCAEAYCNTLERKCHFRAKDADNDGHRAANCTSASGTLEVGDDCDDNDPTLYPGHPKDCSASAHGTAISWPTGSPVGICRFGQISCQGDGTPSACIGAQAPLPRQCGSSDDNDCDGVPDNTIDSVCECIPGSAAVNCSETSDGTGISFPGGQPAANSICHYGQKACTASGKFDSCVGAQGPKARDCTSAADNDCNGEIDDTETNACVCTTGSSRGCQTGLSGICSAGQQSCNSAGSSTNWGTCIETTARKAKDCSSPADNDCNGLNDNTETVCTVCQANTSRTCNTHPGYDGVGTCKAGSQSCINAGSSVGWNGCSGDVSPNYSAEACGPNAADASCDGTAGDGPNCKSSYNLLGLGTWCQDTLASGATSEGPYKNYIISVPTLSAGPGLHSILRCNSGEHFMAIDSCGGATTEGNYGYAYYAGGTCPVGYQQLKRIWNSSTGNSFYVQPSYEGVSVWQTCNNFTVTDSGYCVPAW